MGTKRLDGWVAAAVFVHLIVAIAHGRAHDAAQVPLGPIAYGYVLTIIVAGPLAGLALAALRARAGHVLVALTMAGSLLFGIVNHFVLISPDHVSQVVDQWRTWFTVTAWLLVVTEAAGVAVAVRAASRPLEELS